MQPAEKLLLFNKAWVQDKLELNDQYFESLASNPKPDFLWIGCLDSRVPANEVTGTDAGEMFVHRNIANLVVPNDLNVLSVIQYAVEVLQVKHVIVCGHYECSGIRAAMGDEKLGLIDEWLVNIKHLQQQYQDELNHINDAQARFDRLVELNVRQQILNLSETASVQNMWATHRMPSLHGWVLNLRSGLLKEVMNLVPSDSLAGPGFKAAITSH